MKRSRVTTGAALLVIGLAAGWLYWWNRGPDSHPGVSAQLARVARSPRDTVIHLADYATFAWTDVYVIPPYSGRNAAEASMGVSWPWRWHQIAYRDGISLLVFVDSSRGRITGIVEHPRGQGDFATADSIQHFTTARAVFARSRRDDSWVLFRPVTAP